MTCNIGHRAGQKQVATSRATEEANEEVPKTTVPRMTY